jgi:hypothetical protein
MKKLLTVAIVGYAAYYFISKGKGAYSVYHNLSAKIISVGVPTFSKNEINLPISVLISNPTDLTMNVDTTGPISLRAINIYTTSGKYIGRATPAETNIVLPPHGSQIFKNIPTTINASSILNGLPILDDISQLKTTLEIEVLGQHFLI